MISADDLKRIILDALAQGDTYDGFRTRLREALKALDLDAGDAAARDMVEEYRGAGSTR